MGFFLSNWLDRFLLSTERIITHLTSLEIQLGQDRVGLAVALFFTIAAFLSQFLRTGRRSGLITGLAQGLIRSSWVFPMIYLPYMGTQMWFAIICTILTTAGTWLFLRKAAREKPLKRRQPVASKQNISSNEN